MKNSNQAITIVAGCALMLSASYASAQDWPQWRGPNRDAKVAGFTAPKTWPQELAQKWKVTVGQGDATPALVGGKLYVFARQEASEVTLCLEAGTGKELWQDKYEAQGATGPASGHSGPRSTPTVANGKVVTLGVRGTLSCLDAVTGKKLWRKDDFPGAWPQFFAASSPIIVDDLCIAQLGGQSNGGIVAYDLASGDQKWKWAGEGPGYASPVLMTVDGIKTIITQTEKSMVAIGAADGKLLWQTPFAPQGRGYNAATPIVDGQTLIYAGQGRGAKAVKIEKQGDGFAAKELWSNPDNAVQFNTPVLKNGLLFGLSQRGNFFCINAQSGQTAWTDATGGRGAYGSIVDAGSVLLALTPKSQLIVIQPSEKEYTELASIKVADKQVYGYPVVAGNRLFVKDQDSVTLWTIE
ncbi:MAG: PQQ-binding-like beta-propeller repeat protein [Verrucomicrobiota bacterium]